MSDRTSKRRLPEIIAMAIVAFAVFTHLAPLAEAQTPPAFSSNIDTVFPGAPFLTCIQGQFEGTNPPPTFPTVSPPHFWYIRARQSGTLTIEVRAHAVNADETGSIIATLFDGPTALNSVQVQQPSTGENIGSMTAAVQTPKIYRLEVVRGPHDPSLAEAHHYKLGFSNVLVDVGINSPSFHYLEPETQTFQVNLAQGENLNLNFATDMGPMVGLPSLTVEVSRWDSFPQTLQTLTAPLPFTMTVSNPFIGGSGTLVVQVGGNTHYVMEKGSSSDTGLYFDTCAQAPPPPPPPPPPTPTAKTIGYWKNHEQETASKLPVPLGNYLVDTLTKALAVLDTAHMKNAYDMLAAQFLAARLNILSGVPHACVDAAINDPAPTGATGLLVSSSPQYNGSGTAAAPTGSLKTAVNAVKDMLDNFNNNGCP